MTDQHSKDVHSLLVAYEVIRDVTDRLHEAEKNLTAVQKLCTEQAEMIRRLKQGDV